MAPGSVFLLWHSVDPDDDDLTKLLGVYTSRDGAEGRIASAKNVAGFVDFPDGFLVDEYVLDQDMWIEGFAHLDPDDWVAQDLMMQPGNDPDQ